MAPRTPEYFAPSAPCEAAVRPLNFCVRRSMTLSRGLSLLVLATAYLRAWHIHFSAWYVTLFAAPLLLLIWFPAQIDDYTFGAWYHGYRIDSHTPGVIIASFGWISLLLIVLLLFNPRAIFRFLVGS